MICVRCASAHLSGHARVVSDLNIVKVTHAFPRGVSHPPLTSCLLRCESQSLIQEPALFCTALPLHLIRPGRRRFSRIEYLPVARGRSSCTSRAPRFPRVPESSMCLYSMVTSTKPARCFVFGSKLVPGSNPPPLVTASDSHHKQKAISEEVAFSLSREIVFRSGSVGADSAVQRRARATANA